MSGNTFAPRPLGKARDGRTYDKDSWTLDDLAQARFDALPGDAMQGYRPLLLFEVIRRVHLRQTSVYRNMAVEHLGDMTGLNRVETSRFLNLLKRLGLVTWRPRQGAPGKAMKFGLLSIATPEVLDAFLEVEKCVGSNTVAPVRSVSPATRKRRPRRARSVSSATQTSVSPATHDGVVPLRGTHRDGGKFDATDPDGPSRNGSTVESTVAADVAAIHIDPPPGVTPEQMEKLATKVAGNGASA